MLRFVSRSLTPFLLAALALAGCAGMSGESAWYKNKAAAASTLEKPTLGDPDQRTFVDPSFKGGDLGVVRIMPVSARGTAGGEEMRRFLDRLAKKAEAGAKKAVAESGRSARFAGEGEKPQTILSIEALAHVSTIDSRVNSDPVLNDPRSKVFMIYTFSDAATGKVLIRHTASAVSHWEYAPMAMEDMENSAFKAAEDLLFLLQRY